MDDPEPFIDRMAVQHDWSDERRFARLAATLDHDTSPWPAAVVPPLGHWLCFLPGERQSLIGADGHPTRTKDGLLPDVGLPRRMWAGSRISFLQDMPLNAPIERTSTLMVAVPKSGRSGRMLFVTVEHRISVAGGDVAIVEEQDIVYREAAAPGGSFVRTAADPGESDPTLLMVTPDPVMLFRYSALTFNAHRIHYDRQYARDEEGYPGLVVQGPLIATLMLDHLLQHSKSRVASYSFRAASPSFAGEPIALGFRQVGNETQLRAVGSVGVLMTGTAELKP
ncbi:MULTISPECIES: acyl-CoA dehydrogenase [unclassified Sphingobium]|uniref:acyl-CoA dehydrogenase n=1 Tax=unclassified Sphingobium TaxID=2611147 RepID=UPI0007702C21|nr:MULTISPECIES: acyl-CoA dehydrogenase [unclassified Sphingobium]AMK24127.1 hypothetical protein K426_15975 [Sphingobium sp. TKS]NML91983.1 acyl-CoA dehydrogenase [Sphingobium sp. TB-6]